MHTESNVKNSTLGIVWNILYLKNQSNFFMHLGFAVKKYMRLEFKISPA